MTDQIPFAVEAYSPAQVPYDQWPPGYLPRHVNHPIFEERNHYQATVRGFDAGGFEVTIRDVDLQELADARMRPRGHRKPLEERDEGDMVRSAKRSKMILRLAVKQIGCDHLLTVTTRESENTAESLAIKWKAFIRAYRRNFNEDFPYVAVPERHPSNPKHWHLHIAIRGRLKVNTARQLWWKVCGGRGMGNIDVKYIKVAANANGTPKGPLVRAERIARYIAKYMTEDLIFAHRPDKKRYWRSKFDIPKARRYWLRTRPGVGDERLIESLYEFRQRFGGFDLQKCSIFLFPDQSGLWLSYNPDTTDSEAGADPPPF